MEEIGIIICLKKSRKLICTLKKKIFIVSISAQLEKDIIPKDSLYTLIK